MSKSCWSAAVLAALLGIGPASVSLAKPPDLPIDQNHQCPDGREPVAPVPFTPEELSRLVEEVVEAPVEAAAPRLAEVRQLFEVAERCRLKGEFVEARTYYQEVHLMSPTSRYGRLAMDRLREVEQAEMADTAEEQDAPPLKPVSKPAPSPQERSRELLKRSQPLGLVERVY